MAARGLEDGTAGVRLNADDDHSGHSARTAPVFRGRRRCKQPGCLCLRSHPRCCLVFSHARASVKSVSSRDGTCARHIGPTRQFKRPSIWPLCVLLRAVPRYAAPRRLGTNGGTGETPFATFSLAQQGVSRGQAASAAVSRIMSGIEPPGRPPEEPRTASAVSRRSGAGKRSGMPRVPACGVLRVSAASPAAPARHPYSAADRRSAPAPR